MYLHIKRMLDLLLSLLVLVILSPLLILVAIGIKLDSEGPVLFKQDRLGKNGEIFKIYKFRTMCDNAEKIGSGLFTHDADPRITKVGNVLRKTSMDELPQIFNIIKGEMSIIGPRPPVPYHPHKYEEYDEFQKQRFSVLPGLTGLAQVRLRNAAPWDDRIVLDVQYVRSLSFWQDVKIFFETISSVIYSKDVTQTEDEMKRRMGSNPD